MSWLNYAFRLMQLPIGLFGVAIAAATLPAVSRHKAEGDFQRFGGTLGHSLRLVFAVNVPAAIGLALLGVPIVRVIFEHPRKRQVRPAEAEVHRGQLRLNDELGEVVARAEPREDAVALPAPRDELLARVVRREVPVVFLRVFLDAAMQPVIIPAEYEQDALLLTGHGHCLISEEQNSMLGALP